MPSLGVVRVTQMEMASQFYPLLGLTWAGNLMVVWSAAHPAFRSGGKLYPAVLLRQDVAHPTAQHPQLQVPESQLKEAEAKLSNDRKEAYCSCNGRPSPGLIPAARTSSRHALSPSLGSAFLCV